MKDYFGESVATRYDEAQGEMFQPAHIDSVVDFLVERAGHGPALELGIGTGRIALPLAARGIRVHGIDLSAAMVARLRQKPGAKQIGVTIGDFVTTTVDERFSLAYMVFNTVMNLKTQAEQVVCFQNVAAHLVPGGCFVIEVVVPDPQRLNDGETFSLFNISETVPFRYVSPAELDLFALNAGMPLRERFSGWKREPFTSDSTKHVSVWETFTF